MPSESENNADATVEEPVAEEKAEETVEEKVSPKPKKAADSRRETAKKNSESEKVPVVAGDAPNEGTNELVSRSGRKIKPKRLDADMMDTDGALLTGKRKLTVEGKLEKPSKIKFLSFYKYFIYLCICRCNKC